MDKLKLYFEKEQAEIINKINQVSQKLEFDEDSHTYQYKNRQLFSITTVLKQISSFKFEQIPQQILMHKARLGTLTHQLGENLFYNQEITIQDYFHQVDPFNLWGDEYHQEAMGYFQAMLNYWHQVKPNFFASEIKICDLDDGLAGIVDNLRYDSQLDRYSISDYKTSANIDIHFQALQLVAYGKMINKIIGKNLFTHGVLVQLKKTGLYQEYWFKLSDYELNWELANLNFQINIRPILENKK